MKEKRSEEGRLERLARKQERRTKLRLLRT